MHEATPKHGNCGSGEQRSSSVLKHQTHLQQSQTSQAEQPPSHGATLCQDSPVPPSDFVKSQLSARMRGVYRWLRRLTSMSKHAQNTRLTHLLPTFIIPSHCQVLTRIRDYGETFQLESYCLEKHKPSSPCRNTWRTWCCIWESKYSRSAMR